MALLASDIMDRAAAFLNDAGKQLYTNAVLLPFLKDAYEELQQRLEDNEIVLVNEENTVVINVAANATSITSPTDMARPIAMLERSDGSTEEWSPIEEVDWIDENLDDEMRIVQWCWREDTIYINPPTTARDVILRYQKELTAITSENSAIAVRNSSRFLAARTASLAAMDVGENPSRAMNLDARAERAFDTIIRLEVKQRQSHPVKPNPYGSRKRVSGSATILG